MTNALIPEDEPKDDRWYTFSRFGLVKHREPTIHEYLEAAEILNETTKAIPWNWGDLIILGEDNAVWGEMYTQALDESPYKYSTLTQYVRVCRAFPIERRRPDVDWTHYQHLASLPPPKQEELLDEIEANTIKTTGQTKERVKQERDAGHTRPDELPPPDPEVIYPPCPVCKEPLVLRQGRCKECQATVNEMAYNYRDLEAAHQELLDIVIKFTRDGEIKPLKDFIETQE